MKKSDYPRAVLYEELDAVIVPRLIVLQRLLRAATDNPLDVVPKHDDDEEQWAFFTGMAEQVEDVIEIVRQSHAQALAAEKTARA